MINSIFIKMQSPLISIITPCYNAQNTISSTIESVLSQKYQNWEMLIVDDCSSDDTWQIVDKFAKSDSRIKHYKTNCPSGSPAMPRNVGIEHAQGEYIAFLDSDDIWLPDKLAIQMNFLLSHDYLFVYSDYEKMNQQGRRNNRIVRARSSTNYWDALESCSIPCLTAILSRSIIEKTRFKHYPKEDYVFWLEILRKGYTAYNTRTVEAVYREANNSRSSNKVNMIRHQWNILRKVEKVKWIIAVYFMITYSIQAFLKYIK